MTALVMITPPGNPARVRSVADLARPGVRLAIGAADSSIGRATRAALAQLGAEAALANIVREAPGCGGDDDIGRARRCRCGIVYASQAHALGKRSIRSPIPASAQPVISDAAAVLVSAPHPASAQAFLAYLIGPNGRAYLSQFGFSVP